MQRTSVGRWIILAVAAALVALLGYLAWSSEWLAIDGCLDRGGAWDYERGRCDAP